MEHGPYKAIVNGAFEYEALSPAQLDAVPSGKRKYHILNGPVSLHAEILETDFAQKRYVIKVNGNIYEVRLQDVMDQLVNRLGLSIKTAHRVKDIKAPMPGLVRRIDVTIGQEIKEGDPILILEAMKMENVLKSPGEGRIAKILISEGAPVEKGQVLVEVE
jgi:biotin carboxyl carrier protein